MCEDRGDCFLLIDPASYGTALSSVTSEAAERDSNYAAMYWPWVKIADPDLNKNVWVPASVVIPGVYAFNDRVAAPWFAPAGLNRGGIDVAVQAERKLTQSNRDDLYDANVNPLASFPNTGIVVYGQKTLQKKSSALDRVNVRRLMIAAKKYIASASKFLVFEQNTAVTRNRFLNIVNPYFEDVQQRQGLYAFKVVMDDSNNTPDVIDRNQMVGQIFLQPTKTAEFIVIDFNILPTGAAFPD
jgi:phage tail sheath protein FI